MNTALKIILVDENTGRSAMLRRALQDKGHEVICRMDNSANLQNSNEMTHADVVRMILSAVFINELYRF
jgi:response regulator NasT